MRNATPRQSRGKRQTTKICRGKFCQILSWICRGFVVGLSWVSSFLIVVQNPRQSERKKPNKQEKKREKKKTDNTTLLTSLTQQQQEGRRKTNTTLLTDTTRPFTSMKGNHRRG